MTVTVDRADFWEFKARTTALDLDLVKLRMQLTETMALRNALVNAFAATHGLDPAQPMTLEDTDCSVTQEHKP